ncbi:S-layer homology domain-containing protein [Paenibacillus sp. TRM 82003]|nr:S-layer homology domain-containing protein [Paenibacillus sp. TRM 82003]
MRWGNGWKKTALALGTAVAVALSSWSPTAAPIALAASEWKPLYRGTPWAVVAASDGTLYAGTTTGVYRWSGKGWTYLPGSDRLGVVRQLGRWNGKLIVAARGLWQLDGGAWSRVGGEASPIVGEALFAAMPDGSLAVSDNGPFRDSGGIWSFKGGEWTRLTKEADAFQPTKLAVSPTGVLTVGTQNGYGVVEYVGGRWETVGQADAAESQVSDLAWSPDGVLTIATTRHGVNELRSGRWVRIDEGSPVADTWGNAIAWGPDGELAVGTLGAGVYVRKDGRWSAPAGSPVGKQSVTALHWDTRGLVVGNYNGGFWRLGEQGGWSALGDGQPALSESIRGVWQAAVSPGGVLTVGGTGVWERRDGTWGLLGGAGSPSSQIRVTALTFASNGDAYAGTETGLWQYAGGRWTKLGGASGDAGFAPVNALAWSPDGKLTAATDGFGVLQLSGTELWPLGGATNPLAKASVSSLQWSASGALAAPTADGSLYRYEAGRWTRVGGVTGKFIDTYAISATGELAVAADGLRIGGGAVVAPDQPDDSFYPGALAWSEDGRLAAGSFQDGVWERSVDGAWTELGGADSPLKRRWITGLHWSDDDTLTAATDDGVWTYADGAWALSGLAGHHVEGFVEGTKGRPYALATFALWQPGVAGDPASGAGAGAASGSGSGVGSAGSGFKDVGSHWGASTIAWAVANDIVTGYADGTFKPERSVNEPEFLAMLLRAYPDIQLPEATPGEPWYAPYYAYADNEAWPLSQSTAPERFSRGAVASIIAATQGVGGGERGAIAYLLDRGLANGKSGNTIEGFQAGDALKRVEALQFIKNLIDQGVVVGETSGKTSGRKNAETASTERVAVLGLDIVDAEASD